LFRGQDPKSLISKVKSDYNTIMSLIFIYHIEGNFGGEFGDSLQIRQSFSCQVLIASESNYWLGLSLPKFILPNPIMFAICQSFPLPSFSLYGNLCIFPTLLNCE